jgi:hypothetical protein
LTAAVTAATAATAAALAAASLAPAVAQVEGARMKVSASQQTMKFYG